MVYSSSNSRTGNDHSDILFEDLKDDEFLIVIFFPDVDNLGSQENLKEFKKNYSKFTDFGSKIIAVSTDNQVELNKFSTSAAIKYQLMNTSRVPFIAEMGEIGTTFGDGVLQSKYRAQTVITNKTKEVLIRYRSIIPIRHASQVLNWIIDNTDNQIINPQTGAKELS